MAPARKSSMFATEAHWAVVCDSPEMGQIALRDTNFLWRGFMKNIVRHGMAGIASVAIAMGGLAIAGTAMADTTSATGGSPVTTDQTITINATDEQQLTGHTLKYIQIGSYTQYGSAYGLVTNPTYAADIVSALKTMGYTVPSDYTDNPLAWAENQSPAILGQETVGNSSSNERQLAQALASVAASDGTALTTTSPAANTSGSGSKTTGELSAAGYSETATLPAGVYEIVDTSSSNPSVPIIISTKGGPTVTPDLTNTIDMKNQNTPSAPTKTVTNGSATDDTFDIGQTIDYQVQGVMPDDSNTTTYTYQFIDTPGVGLTLNLDSIKIDGMTVSELNSEAGAGSVTVDPSTGTTLVGNGSDKLTVTLSKAALDYIQTKASTKVAIGGDLDMTYTGYINSQVTDQTADNSAQVDNNGAASQSSPEVAVHTNGSANSGAEPIPNPNNPPSNPVSPDQPSPTSTNVGMWWQKIWPNKTAAKGAKFEVSKTVNGTTEYLERGTNGAGSWQWTTNTADAVQFSSVNGNGLFEIGGLANGTYTVTETTQATGAQAIKPSFTVTLKYGTTETISTTATGDPWGLVSSSDDTVENVKSISQLPMTGGAGIILGALVALLLLGGAATLLLVYRKKSAR